MTGLLGILKTNKKNNRINFEKSQEQIQYYSWYKNDPIYEDENIIASKTHLGIIGEKTSPTILNETLCWVDGECYNINEINKQYGLEANCFAQCLLLLYQSDKLKEGLAIIDGFFNAVIYNKLKSEILIISDRFGLKPLFIWHDEQNFAWTPELKTLLFFNGFKSELRGEIINCFLELGHLMGDDTYFKKVNMISASTIYTYKVNSNKLIKERYWKWSYIKPQNISIKDASVVLGDLLYKAINKRIDSNIDMSISLSGGLDSRVNVAAADNINKLVAFTFGSEKTEDVRIARLVAKLKGMKHIFYELSSDNWFDNRLRSIWLNDGLISMKHLHASQIMDELQKITKINIEGFSGDLIMGGSWITYPDVKINKEYAFAKFGKYYELDDINDSFYDFPHQDGYAINNRVRRFTHTGALNVAKSIELRKPFLDNEVINFCYSIPDSYRVKSNVYNKALLYKFPDFYKDIPWQKTGNPIKSNSQLEYINTFIKRVKQKLNLLPKTEAFVNYCEWLKEDKIRILFTEILDNKEAIYKNYTNVDYYNKYYIPHLNNIADYSEIICRAFTIEVWLQQVFNNKYKN